ncbi:MAG: hypothetical protein NTY99_01760 [DPANN group archaeon]|nr:hypothetical protein [DPANN group archaeon]
MEEETLVLIKPDGVQKNIIGEVMSRFEKAGLRITGLKMVKPTEDQLESHYVLAPEWVSGLAQKTRESFAKKGIELKETDMQIAKRVQTWLKQSLVLMKLERLLLKKEEIPIVPSTNYAYVRPIFTIPIHPKLIDYGTKLDPELARSVFPQALEEWQKDLPKLAQKLRHCEVAQEHLGKYLGKKITLEKGTIQPMGWTCEISKMPNGFAERLDLGVQDDLVYDGATVTPWNTTSYFPNKKFKQYRSDDGNMARYSLHNVDHFANALFFKEWAILYLNEALKQVL